MLPEILFEDNFLLVLNKPAGLAVENDRFGHIGVEGTVQEYFAGRRMPSNTIVGIVHRLDRPVSGVLLIAKKKSILVHLNRQFAEGAVTKTYMAAVSGLPEPAEGTLRQHLTKDPLQKKAIVAVRATKRSTPVSLSYTLERSAAGKGLLRVHPHSGKYHQIRAQLSAAGHPVIGDTLYGSIVPYRADAIMLHAYALRFVHPSTGEEMEITAPFPASWPAALQV